MSQLAPELVSKTEKKRIIDASKLCVPPRSFLFYSSCLGLHDSSDRRCAVQQAPNALSSGKRNRGRRKNSWLSRVRKWCGCTSNDLFRAEEQDIFHSLNMISCSTYMTLLFLIWYIRDVPADSQPKFISVVKRSWSFSVASVEHNTFKYGAIYVFFLIFFCVCPFWPQYRVEGSGVTMVRKTSHCGLH